MSNKDEASSSEELKQNQETNTVTLDEYEKIKDDYLRLAADFENFKKRNEKEKESASFNFVALFVNSLFPLIDNFEIAIKQDNNPKEIESLYKTLQDFMDNLNIVEVPGVLERHLIQISMKQLSIQGMETLKPLKKFYEKVIPWKTSY